MGFDQVIYICRVHSVLNVRYVLPIPHNMSTSLSNCSTSLIGTADLSTLEMSAVTIRKVMKDDLWSPHVNHIVRGCIFDIPTTELASYLEREHRYVPIQLEVTDDTVRIEYFTTTCSVLHVISIIISRRHNDNIVHIYICLLCLIILLLAFG